MQALEAEIGAWAQKSGKDHTFVSIYFGGGTPSLMQPESVARILQAATTLGEITPTTEITVECNPTSSPRPTLDALKMAGVNRVSIGVQGLRDDWLTFLGRAHTTRQAIETVEHALHLFDNVNADVIYGLPTQDLAAWQTQLTQLAHMGLSHISAYQLTIEPQTRFFTDVRRGLWQPVDSDVEATFFDLTRETLCQAGFENYETSNFAKPGFACRHNVHVWMYGSYIGIGAGAHGRPILAEGTRLATAVLRQPDAYLSAIATQNTPFATYFTLSATQQLQEAVFLGLRLQQGICLSSLIKRFGWTAYKEGIDGEAIRFLQHRGLLVEGDTSLRLTETGWPLLNGVLNQILTEPPTPGA